MNYLSTRLFLISLFLSLIISPQVSAIRSLSAADTNSKSTLASLASEGFFLNTANKTRSARVVVDINGAIHVAFASSGRDEQGKAPGYYAYCASNCSAASSWAVTTISDGSSEVNQVQLAVDGAGHPRLMLYGNDAQLNYQWQYAACDTNCGTSASWKVLTLAQVSALADIFVFDYSMHNFALDPQGHPHMVYYNDEYGHLNGTLYASCTANCTTLANWTEIQLSENKFSQPSLAYTSTGQPRIVSVVYLGGSDPTMLRYFECATNCTKSNSWTQTPLYERGGGQAGWVLRLDGQDRPRLAFYQASLDNGGGRQLYYAWCNSSCVNAGSWGRASVGLTQGDGLEPDLALDSQSRPQLVYRTLLSDGLAYGYCTANCESAQASWQHSIVEPSEVLDAAWPILPPSGCGLAFWLGGYFPSIALDTSDRPYIGYEAQHIHGKGCTTGEDYRATRLLLTAREAQVYLPLTTK